MKGVDEAATATVRRPCAHAVGRRRLASAEVDLAVALVRAGLSPVGAKLVVDGSTSANTVRNMRTRSDRAKARRAGRPLPEPMALDVETR